jgi:molybdenum cofactor cytidylyltransferase
MSLAPEPGGSVGAGSSPPAVAGLILAAGESSRMGCDKALLEYRGRTFLESIVNTLHEAGVERVIVVLGHHAEEIREAIDLGATEVVVNRDYRLGQTSSLQAGLRALEENEPVGVFLCLVDHPDSAAFTLRQMLRTFKSSGAPVVIPEFQGRHGHPILVGRELFAELRALGPDSGADSVILKHRAQTRFVEVSDPGILLDVDDPETYKQLTSQS